MKRVNIVFRDGRTDYAENVIEIKRHSNYGMVVLVIEPNGKDSRYERAFMADDIREMNYPVGIKVNHYN